MRCYLNEKPVLFEIDSGACVSTIIQSDFSMLNVDMLPCKRKIRGYSGSEIEVNGETLLDFTCCGINFKVHRLLSARQLSAANFEPKTIARGQLSADF